MFKKLVFLVLAINSTYAMESLLPTDENNIKQTIENVKQVPNDSKRSVNDVTDEFSTLNIDKTVQQLNNVKDENNKVNVLDIKDVNEAQPLKVNKIEIEDNTFANSDSLMFDMIKLMHNKGLRFKEMNSNEQDWVRLMIYNYFSQECHLFIQNAFTSKVVTTDIKDGFYKSDLIKYCVMIGLKPHQIFYDEFKFNIDPACYHGIPEATGIIQQLKNVCRLLFKLRYAYQCDMLRKGYIDKFWE